MKGRFSWPYKITLLLLLFGLLIGIEKAYPMTPQKEIVVYTLSYCPACAKLKQFVIDKDLKVIYKEIDTNPKYLTELETYKLSKTVPKVFVEGEYIGGLEELKRMFYKGELIK